MWYWSFFSPTFMVTVHCGRKMLCITSMSNRIYLLPTLVWLCHCWVYKIPLVNSITNSLIGHNSLEKTTRNLWHLRSLKLLNLEVLLWKIGWRIQRFHCCGSGHRYGVGLIAGSGTSTFHWHSQQANKWTNRNKKQKPSQLEGDSILQWYILSVYLFPLIVVRLLALLFMEQNAWPIAKLLHSPSSLTSSHII